MNIIESPQYGELFLLYKMRFSHNTFRPVLKIKHLTLFNFSVTFYGSFDFNIISLF